MKKIESNWYGMWVWDFLNLKRSDIADEAWAAFDIWKKAYIQANPELSELNDLELIEDHYCEATSCLFDSWLFKAWLLFYLPSRLICTLTWEIRSEYYKIRGIHNNER